MVISGFLSNNHGLTHPGWLTWYDFVPEWAPETQLDSSWYRQNLSWLHLQRSLALQVIVVVRWCSNEQFIASLLWQVAQHLLILQKIDCTGEGADSCQRIFSLKGQMWSP